MPKIIAFEHAGILLRHRCQNGSAVYELAKVEHHDHMVCLRCNQIMEFHDPAIEDHKTRIARDAGFELEDHVLYLYVKCTRPNCLNRTGKDSGF